MPFGFLGKPWPAGADRLRALLTTSVLSLMLAGPLAKAGTVDVYKWVDKAGKVHYGDRASSEEHGKKIEIDATTPSPDPDQAVHEERSRKLLHDIEKDRSDAAAKAAAKRAKEEKRKKKCTVARQHLDKYEHASYLYQTDKNGNRRILTDAEHDKALAQWRQAVQDWCGPAGNAP